MDNILAMNSQDKKKNRMIFITGGARSGKSTFAQQLASTISNDVLFIATAEPLDDEMAERIKNHRESRPKSWKTLELPRNLSNSLLDKQIKSDVVIIDCLTLLVANLMQESTSMSILEKQVLSEIAALINFIKSTAADYIIVSNEVGLGLVPDNKLARDYRDILGKVNQVMAQNADDIYFMISGIPQKIK
jgi:adenosylcobinamide kinase/adenosylcobinamide-phosphate guanylyltransferase